MNQEQNANAQGMLLRGGGGELYFISDETLQASRLSEEAAARAEQMISEAGDVQGFTLGAGLPLPLLRLGLDNLGTELSINYNSSKSNITPTVPSGADGAAKGQATE